MFEIIRQELVEVKEKALARRNATRAMEEIDIEPELDKVIDSLIGIRDRNILVPLSLDALQIKEKIPENDICYEDIKNRALKYYNYINAYLKKHEARTINGSTKLGMEIKEISNRLMSLGETPSNIVDYIAENLNSRISGNNTSLKACEILVAYFVQHCEILSKEVSEHEISE